jgi:hypothetical protein
MRYLVIIAGLSILIIACGSPEAITFRADVTPRIGADTLWAGVPFTVDLYMNNNDGFDHLGYSLPLYFYSPDQSLTAVSHRNVHGYGAQTIDFPHIQYNDSSILMLNGFNDIWNFMNCWYGFSWDGLLPDTINHTTASLTGWPSGLGEKLYIKFAFITEETGVFCVDSLDHPNDAYDWLFDPVGSNYPFNGPYCWTIATPPFMCGDADNNGVISLLDVTYLINFLYKGGPPLSTPEAGDADGNGRLDLLDIVYLINYLYMGGPYPLCRYE